MDSLFKQMVMKSLDIHKQKKKQKLKPKPHLYKN